MSSNSSVSVPLSAPEMEMGGVNLDYNEEPVRWVNCSVWQVVILPSCHDSVDIQTIHRAGNQILNVTGEECLIVPSTPSVCILNVSITDYVQSTIKFSSSMIKDVLHVHQCTNLWLSPDAADEHFAIKYMIYSDSFFMALQFHLLSLRKSSGIKSYIDKWCQNE